jgi:hypothetical protein
LIGRRFHGREPPLGSSRSASMEVGWKRREIAGCKGKSADFCAFGSSEAGNGFFRMENHNAFLSASYLFLGSIPSISLFRVGRVWWKVSLLERVRLHLPNIERLPSSFPSSLYGLGTLEAFTKWSECLGRSGSGFWRISALVDRWSVARGRLVCAGAGACVRYILTVHFSISSIGEGEKSGKQMIALTFVVLRKWSEGPIGFMCSVQLRSQDRSRGGSRKSRRQSPVGPPPNSFRDFFPARRIFPPLGLVLLAKGAL